ncbi:MAG: hypothetical protein LAP38_14990 [Acidobacteriia bacterium]|nr:hypothetical protein [Terriglobia bacterium]
MSAQKLSVTYVELPIIVNRAVTYASGERAEVPLGGIFESLAIFYDEVCLPFPYGFDRHGPVLWSISTEPGQTDAFKQTMDEMFTEYQRWRDEWKPLFDRGVVRVLPPAIQDVSQVPQGFSDAIRRRLADEQGRLSIFPLLSGEFALTVHTLYGTKPSPELIPSHPANAVDAVLTHSLFSCLVPRLNALTAEEVMELRDDLGDLREGFRAYINESLDDVEARVKDGVSIWDAAHRTSERKIIPKYEEMQRQLAAKATGKWAKILSPLSKVMQIDASPWTPKFYGQLFEAFFGSSGAVAEAEKEAQTNAGQAFQFLARLESKAGEFGASAAE